jgi:hypothetical protein
MLFRSTVLALFSVLAGCTGIKANMPSAEPHNSLHETTIEGFTEAYRQQHVDFTKYSGILLTDLEIEFLRGWQDSQNITDPHRITDRDLRLIRTNLAAEYRNSFTQALAKSARFHIVAAPDDFVLKIRPVIRKLNIQNPDNKEPYQSLTYAEVSASMQIDFEISDASSGRILLKLSDRGRTRDYTSYSRQESVKNQADISKLLLDWNVKLLDILSAKNS